MNRRVKLAYFLVIVKFGFLACIGCANIHKGGVYPKTQHSIPSISKKIENIKIRPVYKSVPLSKVQLKKTEKFIPSVKKARQNPIYEIKNSVKEAIQQPDSENSINATTVYNYVPNYIFTIYCSPIRITTIMLQEGEKLCSPPAIGDSVRWKIAESHTGRGDNMRVILWIKPIFKDIETNIIITTDRRIYFLDVKSYTETFQRAIKWIYPEENFTEFQKEIEKDDEVKDSKFYVNLQEMNYRYTIKGNTNWTPIKVFDDGYKTYILFPKEIEQYELPPLYIKSDDTHEGQLVNYRYINGYYIVDRLFEQAFLKMGNKRSKIVYITMIK